MAEVLPELVPTHPVLHLAPRKAWMNDPNGLSYVDGRWHAYYQHNPVDDVWGPMHWRHASSTDLLHWDDHGIALAPTELGAIFSGTIAIDHANTTGFGPHARVAAFTLDRADGQTQGIAHSHDGLTWTMYEDNPVLCAPGVKDFRDPKVFRFEDRWIMALAVGDHLGFFRSADMRSWEECGRYEPSCRLAGTIECPDLLPIVTESGETAYVLIYSDDRGGPDGHTSSSAVVGSFDGSKFTEWATPARLDDGPDFYAAQTFATTGSADAIEPPIMLGWLNSWRYSNNHPSNGRRGVMSLPRSLTVRSKTDPVIRVAPAVSLQGESIASPVAANPDRAVVIVGPEFEARLLSSGGETSVAIHVTPTRLTVDRPDIGIDHFASSIQLEKSAGDVTVVIDHGTLEVFAGNGRTVSMLTFPGRQWSVEFDGDASAQLLS